MNRTFQNYVRKLTTESEEEIELRKKLNDETDKFEASDAYKEYDKRRKKLINKISQARLKRLDEAKKLKPTRSRITPKKGGSGHKKEDSEELKAAIEAVNKLTYSDKLTLRARISEDDRLEVDTERKLSDKDIDDIHIALVQTAIDLVKEKKLENVWSISFSADSLQESAEYGEWCQATDSYLRIEGIKFDEFVGDDGVKRAIPYRVILGEQW